MARAISSHVWFKPWSTPVKEPAVLDVLSSWQLLYSRGADDPDSYALREINSTGIVPKIRKLQFRHLIDVPTIAVISITSEKELRSQPIFRPSSDQPSHADVRIVKFLEINSLGVKPV